MADLSRVWLEDLRFVCEEQQKLPADLGVNRPRRAEVCPC